MNQSTEYGKVSGGRTIGTPSSLKAMSATGMRKKKYGTKAKKKEY